jgi:hypothetical protein
MLRSHGWRPSRASRARAARSACSPYGSSRSPFPSALRAGALRARRGTRRTSGANLLTYLVEHEDGRAGNVLVSKAPEDRRVFAIDNGIAFGAIVKNWFVPNWNVIRHPAVPHLEIDRLRRSTAAGSTGLAWWPS